MWENAMEIDGGRYVRETTVREYLTESSGFDRTRVLAGYWVQKDAASATQTFPNPNITQNSG